MTLEIRPSKAFRLFNVGGTVGVIPTDVGSVERNPMSLERNNLDHIKRDKFDSLTQKRENFDKKYKAYTQQAIALSVANPDSMGLHTISIVGACIELNEYIAAKKVISFAKENEMRITQQVLEAQIDGSNLLVTANSDVMSIVQLYEGEQSQDHSVKALGLFTKAFVDTIDIATKASANPPEIVHPTVEGHALYVVAMTLLEKNRVIDFDRNFPGLKISLDTTDVFSRLKEKIGLTQSGIREAVLDLNDNQIREEVSRYLENDELGTYLFIVLGLTTAQELLEYTGQVENLAAQLEDGEDREFYVNFSSKLYDNFTQSFGHVLEALQFEEPISEVEEVVVYQAQEVSAKKKEPELNSAGTENLAINEGNSMLLKKIQKGVRF